MAMHRHVASVTQEDGYWVATVAGVPGGATETRALPELHDEVVDLLAGLLEVDENEIEVQLVGGHT